MKTKKKSTMGKSPVENSTPKPVNKGGRPSKFRPEMVQQLIDFFSVPPTKEVDVVIKQKNGTEIYKTEEKANSLPMLIKFAQQIGVSMETMNQWSKDNDKYPGFPEAYKTAKELQKNFLIENALKGLYNATAFIFTAKNITDMRDKTEVEHGATDDVLKALASTPEEKANEIIKRAAESLKGE